MLFTQYLVKDKRFYQSFFAMTAALALQQLLSYSVNLADNIMLGAYDELAMSGSSLGSQIHYVLQLMINGIGSGIVILGSRWWGKGETEPIRRLFGTGWKVAVAIGAVFFLLTKFAPYPVLSFFTPDEAVLEQGLEYMELACWTYLIFPISYSLTWCLRSVETTFMGPLLSAVSLVTNVVLNYVFIFGNLGAPEMGAAGAALATLISRILECVILFLYLFFVDKKVHLRPVHLLQPRCYDFKRFLKVASPSTGGLFLFAVGCAMQTAVLGHTTESAIAANSIMNIVWQIFAVVGMTCGSASSVIIGKAVGEGRRSLVDTYSKTLQCIYLLIGVVSSGLLLLCRGLILSFYTLSPETMALSEQMLLVLCIIVFSSCYQYPVSSGIIQGGGNTMFGFVVDSAALWLFALPFAWLSAFVFHWPVIVTFFLLKSDQCLKMFINAYWVNKRKWFRDLG